MKTYIDLLINNLHEDTQQGRSVDIVAYLNYLTFDLIGDLSFASPFDALKNRAAHPWMSTFFASVIEGTILGQLLQFPILLPLLSLFSGSLRKSAKQQIEYTQEKVRGRIEGGAERHDFMAQVLKNNDFADLDKGMTRPEIDVTFNLLMIAGSETTATLLSGCMFLLAKNKGIARKLKDEVRRAFADTEEITVVKVCFELDLSVLLGREANAEIGQSTTISPCSYRRSTPYLSSSSNRSVSYHAA
jgi:cytochrome P450